MEILLVHTVDRHIQVPNNCHAKRINLPGSHNHLNELPQLFHSAFSDLILRFLYITLHFTQWTDDFYSMQI